MERCTLSCATARKCSTHLPFPVLKPMGKPSTPKVSTCPLQPNISPGKSRENTFEVGRCIISWSRHAGLRELPAILQVDGASRTHEKHISCSRISTLTSCGFNAVLNLSPQLDDGFLHTRPAILVVALTIQKASLNYV